MLRSRAQTSDASRHAHWRYEFFWGADRRSKVVFQEKPFRTISKTFSILLRRGFLSFSRHALFGEHLGGTYRKELLDCPLNRRPVGLGAECDGLEDLASPRKIGNASCLSAKLHGKAGDKLPD